MTRYDVRMAPQDVLDGDRIRIERPDSLPREEGIPRSATSTPESTTLVTPVSGDMRHISIKEESPTPNAPRQKRAALQESGDFEEDVKPKKKARVAFA